MSKKVIVPESDQVDELTSSQKSKALKFLIEELDNLGDELGTEGWRHRFGLED